MCGSPSSQQVWGRESDPHVPPQQVPPSSLPRRDEAVRKKGLSGSPSPSACVKAHEGALRGLCGGALWGGKEGGGRWGVSPQAPTHPCWRGGRESRPLSPSRRRFFRAPLQGPPSPSPKVQPRRVFRGASSGSCCPSADDPHPGQPARLILHAENPLPGMKSPPITTSTAPTPPRQPLSPSLSPRRSGRLDGWAAGEGEVGGRHKAHARPDSPAPAKEVGDRLGRGTLVSTAPSAH